MTRKRMTEEQYVKLQNQMVKEGLCLIMAAYTLCRDCHIGAEACSVRALHDKRFDLLEKKLGLSYPLLADLYEKFGGKISEKFNLAEKWAAENCKK